MGEFDPTVQIVIQYGLVLLMIALLGLVFVLILFVMKRLTAPIQVQGQFQHWGSYGGGNGNGSHEDREAVAEAIEEEAAPPTLTNRQLIEQELKTAEVAMTSKEIAERVHLTETNVKKILAHRNNADVFHKVRNQWGLVKWAEGPAKVEAKES